MASKGGTPFPKARKTGTTIVGVVFKVCAQHTGVPHFSPPTQKRISLCSAAASGDSIGSRTSAICAPLRRPSQTPLADAPRNRPLAATTAAHPYRRSPLPPLTRPRLCFVSVQGGVVLGADTRATEGDTVCDKNCEKIHYIADNIWCCGAGTSADTENTTMLISSQLELHRMATGKQPRVVTACTMLKRMLFRYQGNVSAALVLGGMDCNGPSLYTVYPHGSTDSLPYVTMGSGSLAAMAVFEAEYKSGMTLEEAKQLVYNGIMAGINNDLGSGGSVDLMVIDKEGNHPLRNYDRPNERALRPPPPPPSPHPPSGVPHAHTRRRRQPHATQPAAI